MNSKLLAATGLLLFVVNAASAQPFTTVQLPTFQRFSIGTSVLVPDQGSVNLGGVNRSFQSSSQRGAPFLPSTGSRSRGASAGGVSVSAYIHHFEELDEAVLAEARRRRGGLPRQQVTQTQRRPATSSMSRVSDLRAKTRAKQRVQQTYAEEDYALAQKLLAKGKIGGARNLLSNAHKRGDAKLKSTIEQQLAELDRIPPRTRIVSR